MSSEPAAGRRAPGHDADASRRQRLGIFLTLGLGLAAALVSYFGTRDTWRAHDRSPEGRLAETTLLAADPAWDIELPAGPHRDEFQTSCLICHSARLPLSQPPFHRAKWVEVVHKMVDAYGARNDPRGGIPCRGLLARQPAARSLTGRPSDSNFIPR